jgi:hypothetical protein
LERLADTAAGLAAQNTDGGVVDLTEAKVGEEAVISLSTPAGSLRILGSPTGAPNGYVDLRRAATREHLGQGVQPLVASVGDLARMASALHREQDLKRLPQLRHIIELEADREQTLRPSGSARQPTRSASRAAPAGR